MEEVHLLPFIIVRLMICTRSLKKKWVLEGVMEATFSISILQTSWLPATSIFKQTLSMIFSL